MTFDISSVDLLNDLVHHSLSSSPCSPIISTSAKFNLCIQPPTRRVTVEKENAEMCRLEKGQKCLIGDASGR